MRPGMMRERLRSRVALTVMRCSFREAVRTTASGRKCIPVVAMPKTQACAMSYSHRTAVTAAMSTTAVATTAPRTACTSASASAATASAATASASSTTTVREGGDADGKEETEDGKQDRFHDPFRRL
jgi:hypothetical protein